MRQTIKTLLAAAAIQGHNNPLVPLAQLMVGDDYVSTAELRHLHGMLAEHGHQLLLTKLQMKCLEQAIGVLQQDAYASSQHIAPDQVAELTQAIADQLARQRPLLLPLDEQRVYVMLFQEDGERLPARMGDDLRIDRSKNQFIYLGDEKEDVPPAMMAEREQCMSQARQHRAHFVDDFLQTFIGNLSQALNENADPSLLLSTLQQEFSVVCSDDQVYMTQRRAVQSMLRLFEAQYDAKEQARREQLNDYIDWMRMAAAGHPSIAACYDVLIEAVAVDDPGEAHQVLKRSLGAFLIGMDESYDDVLDAALAMASDFDDGSHPGDEARDRKMLSVLPLRASQQPPANLFQAVAEHLDTMDELTLRSTMAERRRAQSGGDDSFKSYYDGILSGMIDGGEFELRQLQDLLDRRIVVLQPNGDLLQLQTDVTEKHPPLFVQFDGRGYTALYLAEPLSGADLAAYLDSPRPRGALLAEKHEPAREPSVEDHAVALRPSEGSTLLHLAAHYGAGDMLGGLLGGNQQPRFTDGYLVEPISAERSVWQQLFGVGRETARDTLLMHAPEVVDMMASFNASFEDHVQEGLVDSQAFLEEIAQGVVRQAEAARDRQRQRSKDEAFAYYLGGLMDSFMDDQYDWPHPIVLCAYAKVKGIRLRLWMPDAAQGGVLLPYERDDMPADFAAFQASPLAATEIDLLMAGKNRCEFMVLRFKQNTMAAEAHFGADRCLPSQCIPVDRFDDTRRPTLWSRLHADADGAYRAFIHAGDAYDDVFGSDAAKGLKEALKASIRMHQKEVLSVPNASGDAFFAVRGPGLNMALHQLMHRGMRAMAAVLVTYDADPSLANAEAEVPCMMRNARGDLLVHTAYRDGYFEAVKRLLGHFYNDLGVKTRPSVDNEEEGESLMAMIEHEALEVLDSGRRRVFTGEQAGAGLDEKRCVFPLVSWLRTFYKAHYQRHEAYWNANHALEERFVNGDLTDEAWAVEKAALDEQFDLVHRQFSSPTGLRGGDVRGRTWSKLGLLIDRMERLANDPQMGLLARWHQSRCITKRGHAAWLSQANEVVDLLNFMALRCHVAQDDQALYALMNSPEMALLPIDLQQQLAEAGNQCLKTPGYAHRFEPIVRGFQEKDEEIEFLRSLLLSHGINPQTSRGQGGSFLSGSGLFRSRRGAPQQPSVRPFGAVDEDNQPGGSAAPAPAPGGQHVIND